MPNMIACIYGVPKFIYCGMLCVWRLVLQTSLWVQFFHQAPPPAATEFLRSFRTSLLGVMTTLSLGCVVVVI